MGKRPNVNLTEGGAPSAAEGSPRLIQIEFPKQITPFVWLAMAVGLLLVVSGFVAHLFVGSAGVKENLSLASGIALILSAFGGQAAVRGKAFVFAGSAGIAVGLFSFLNAQPSSMVNSYVQGRISNVPESKYDIHLQFRTYALGAHTSGPSQFEYVAFETNINSVNEATLDIRKKDDPSDVSDSFGIPISCFQPWIGIDQIIDWRYEPARNDSETSKIVEVGVGSRVISELGGAKTDGCAGPKKSAELTQNRGIDIAIVNHHPSAGLGLIGSAIADGLYVQAPLPQPVTADIDQALAALNSDKPDLKRSARDVLSRTAPADLRHVLDYAQEHKADPQVALGISLGLTQMLRRDKSLGAQINLTQPDIDLLLDFATSSDRTLRIYSGEFLYDLGNPDVANSALARASQLGTDTTLDDARFNLLFVAQDGYRKLPDQAKQNLAPAFSQIQSTLNANPANYQKTQTIFNNLKKLAQ